MYVKEPMIEHFVKMLIYYHRIRKNTV